MNRILLLATVFVLRTSLLGAAEPETPSDAGDLLARSNLVAWCIVPFDAKQRGPGERAAMLKELGIRRCAYDWRAEHVPSFEQEILAYREHGIEFFAFWGVHEAAFRLFEQYDLHPQIWQTLGEPAADNDEEKVAMAAEQLLPLVRRTKQLSCQLGLYNHGGWGGEPKNLVAVCRRLRELGYSHVGIVYNFHHGHGHIDDWPAAWSMMKPYVLCLNLNGMNRDADPKILGIGKGNHEAEMIRQVVESGYSGPIGILDHRNELDARESLEENLRGLERLHQEMLRSDGEETSSDRSAALDANLATFSWPASEVNRGWQLWTFVPPKCPAKSPCQRSAVKFADSARYGDRSGIRRP